MSANTDVLEQFFAAINRFDIEACTALLDPQVVRMEPEGHATTGTYHGIAELREHLSKGRGSWAEGSCDPEQMLENGNKVVVYLHARVRMKETGEWIDGRFADGFVLRAGKIMHYQTFWQRSDALDWAGIADNDETREEEQDNMSLEQQCKEVVLNYVDAFNRGDLVALESLLADEAEIQGVFGKGLFERIRPVWKQLIEGFAMQLQVKGMIAEGNTVAVRYIETGTFRADAFGHKATGKSYELVAMEWFEIESGKIKRRWGARDSASQYRQLGIAT